MDEQLAVLLNGELIGYVTRRSINDLCFFYEDGARNPLSVSMPITTRSYPHSVIAPYMFGLLPEDERVLRRWGSEFGVSSNDAFGLLSHMGEDCPGAVQFLTLDRIETTREHKGIEWVEEAYIAERLRILRNDPSAWRSADEITNFSLGGNQSKFALVCRDGRWGRPFGGVATTHIIKPGVMVDSWDDQALNEHLCQQAASNLGLAAARTTIVQFEDQEAIVIERFDRQWLDGNLIRIHQEDICQAFAQMPNSKYERDGGPTAERIARLLEKHIFPRHASEIDKRRFVDALLFNWLIGGTDAHAKNYCLLHAGGSVRLGPLYDVASMFPYHQYHKLQMAMKIGGQYAIKYVNSSHWVNVASIFGIPSEEVIERALELASQLPDALSEACAQVANLHRVLPQRLLSDVSENCVRCTAKLRLN